MSQWGPWITHDGKGCPCLGQYVQVVGIMTGAISEGIARHQNASWVWVTYTHPNGSLHYIFPDGCDGIEKYRVRKPKGLFILEAVLESTKDLCYSSENNKDV